MAKIKPEQLAEVFKEIFDDYKGDLVRTSEEVVKEAGKKTAQALKTSASSVFSGKYPSSWGYKVEKGAFPTAIIYSKIPGLPHLLEHGHATTKGGRVPGKPHIAPVEERAIEDFYREMERALQNV